MRKTASAPGRTVVVQGPDRTSGEDALGTEPLGELSALPIDWSAGSVNPEPISPTQPEIELASAHG